MAECYLLTDEGGKVTAKRIRKNRNGHWETFGSVPLLDLPIPEIRLAIEMQKLLERHRSER